MMAAHHGDYRIREICELVARGLHNCSDERFEWYAEKLLHVVSDAMHDRRTIKQSQSLFEDFALLEKLAEDDIKKTMRHIDVSASPIKKAVNERV